MTDFLEYVMYFPPQEGGEPISYTSRAYLDAEPYIAAAGNRQGNSFTRVKALNHFIS
jgi:hypothetical protein